MKKYILRIVFLGFLGTMLMSSNPVSYNQPAIPNPTTFGTKLIDILRKKDSLLFIKTFTLDSADFREISSIILNDPYYAPNKKESLKRELSNNDLMQFEEMKKHNGESYSTIQSFLKSHKIDISKTEYVRIYFKMQYNNGDGGIPYIRNAKICMKYDTTYFTINFSDLIPNKDKWNFMEIRDIDITNAYFEIEETYQDALIDTNAIDSAVPDTVAIAPEVTTEPKKLTKKQLKLESKIEKLQKQLDGLSH